MLAVLSFWKRLPVFDDILDFEEFKQIFVPEAGGIYESRIRGWDRKLVKRFEASDRQLFIIC